MCIRDSYNYTTTDIKVIEEEGYREFSSDNSIFRIKINTDNLTPDLPSHSPFKTWKEARRYAGPLPFTFTYNKADKSVLIIEGVRSNWKPQAIDVTDYHFNYLDELNLDNLILSNAFEITDVPYFWKKGKKDIWK